MKRETTITIGGDKTIPVDYDEMLADLAASSGEEALEALCDDFYWLVALPWIAGGKIRKQAFLGNFQERTKQRMNALKGDKVVAHEPELDLLRFTKAYINSESQRATTERIIGLRFMKLVKEDKHTSLSKMANIMKDGGVTSGRGGFKTEGGKIKARSMRVKLLLAFCDIHMDTEALPTRGEILDSLNLTGEKRKQARIDLDELGFKGLEP